MVFKIPSKRTECGARPRLATIEGTAELGAPGARFLWFVSFGEAKEMNLQRAAPAPKSCGIAA